MWWRVEEEGGEEESLSFSQWIEGLGDSYILLDK